MKIGSSSRLLEGKREAEEQNPLCGQWKGKKGIPLQTFCWSGCLLVFFLMEEANVNHGHSI